MSAGRQGALLEQAIISPAWPTTECNIAEVSADRLVFDVENVSTMRYLFLTLFSPGVMQSIYFLDRESDDVWRYYSIARIGRNASRLATGPDTRLPPSTGPWRSIAPWLEFPPTRTSGGAMNVTRRFLDARSRLGRLPWRRGLVRFWLAPQSLPPLWLQA